MIEHGPHSINFIILTFISEILNTLKGYIKFGTKLFWLTWEKKVIGHGKCEKKGEFGSPWNESLGFKCGTPIMLGPKSISNGNNQ